MRPVICICNDMYTYSQLMLYFIFVSFAPVLRELREVAQVVRVDRVSPALLMDRLKDICERENIYVDPQIMSDLVDSCNYDLRACLNVLQVFFLLAMLISI